MREYRDPSESGKTQHLKTADLSQGDGKSRHEGEDRVSTIHLPETIDQAIIQLTGVESLLTATQWERAAIVYTFTEVTDKPGPKSSVSSDRSLSFAEFAALGIAVLKSKNTVQRYHQLWAEHGDTSIQPGGQVELPTIHWPPIEWPQIHSKTGAAADQLSERLDDMSDDELMAAVSVLDREQTKRHPRVFQPRPSQGPDYNKITRDAVYDIFVVLIAEKGGKWTLDDTAQAYLSLLLRRLSDRQAPPESVDSLIAGIEDHLQTAAKEA